MMGVVSYSAKEFQDAFPVGDVVFYHGAVCVVVGHRGPRYSNDLATAVLLRQTDGREVVAYWWDLK